MNSRQQSIGPPIGLVIAAGDKRVQATSLLRRCGVPISMLLSCMGDEDSGWARQRNPRLPTQALPWQVF